MMIRNSLVCACFAACLIAICRCDDDKGMLAPWKAHGPAYFPLAVGNYWEYDVSGLLETSFRWTVIDTIRHTDGSLLYAFHQNEHPDTCIYYYYTVHDDGVYFYSGPTDTTEDRQGQRYPTVKRKILEMEMDNTSEWLTYDFPTSIPDTFRLVTGLKLHLGDYYFKNVILVVRNRTFSIDSLYYEKGVGLLRGVYQDRSGWPTQVIEIEDYSIQ
jgi:hypothetical protein